MTVEHSSLAPTMVLLGAWHGVNPAMGWLFAVALGLQEGRGGAVLRALPPLALGHALAIGAAVLAAAAAGAVLGQEPVKWIVAAALLAFGISRLVRARHPTWGGMRVGFRDLVLWSALVASAHGAGLMVIPWTMSTGSMMHGGGAPVGLLATALHTAGYLLVTALAAFLVYRWLGLRWLRTLWFNLDLVWGVALIVTAVATPLL
jgi:hypothetical protein